MSITFDPVKHIYLNGEKRVPSLSEVLRKVGLTKSYEGIDPFYAARGVATHLANEYWLFGKLDEGSIDPEVKPFHTAFRNHMAKTGFSPMLVEKVMYSEKENFACRIDYYGTQNGYFWLKDAKCTKSHDKGADFQLCMQAFAMEEMGHQVEKMSILELHEDGTWDDYPYAVDLSIAPAIMKLYRRRIM